MSVVLGIRPSPSHPSLRRGPSSSISFSNVPNRYLASCGPGPASGWYCTPKAGADSCTDPSMTPSFRLTWVISAMPFKRGPETA